LGCSPPTIVVFIIVGAVAIASACAAIARATVSTCAVAGAASMSANIAKSTILVMRDSCIGGRRPAQRRVRTDARPSAGV